MTYQFNDIGIDTIHIKKLLEEMANLYVELKNQYRYKYQTTFSTVFDKNAEDGEVLNQIEITITSSITKT